MPLQSISTFTFRVQHDEFSAQVTCDQDPKFWYRLEVAQNRDDITDFFLGAFDPSLGGDLLAMCYNKIGRLPQDRILFSDILSSQPSEAAAIDTIRASLEKYTKTMLAAFGRSMRASRVVPRRDKLDLVIDT